MLLIFSFLENSIILFSIYLMKLEFFDVMRRSTKSSRGQKSLKNLYFHLSFGWIKYKVFVMIAIPSSPSSSFNRSASGIFPFWNLKAREKRENPSLWWSLKENFSIEFSHHPKKLVSLSRQKLPFPRLKIKSIAKKGERKFCFSFGWCVAKGKWKDGKISKEMITSAFFNFTKFLYRLLRFHSVFFCFETWLKFDDTEIKLKKHWIFFYL